MKELKTSEFWSILSSNTKISDSNIVDKISIPKFFSRNRYEVSNCIFDSKISIDSFGTSLTFNSCIFKDSIKLNSTNVGVSLFFIDCQIQSIQSFSNSKINNLEIEHKEGKKNRNLLRIEKTYLLGNKDNYEILIEQAKD
jgi:hypothetical protein